MAPRTDRAQALTALPLALALTAGVLGALLWPRPPACLPPPPLVERAGVLRPAPLVSRGCPVASSTQGAGVLVDGTYRTEAWGGGHPTPEHPAWAAVQLPPGLTRVLVSWTSSQIGRAHV